MSNVIGLFGLWAAAHPPNAQYPYGHKKYETFAAAGIGLLLFGTCLYILWNSYLHWRESVVPEVTGLSFGIMLGTIAVNWGVMTWEHRRGKILQSEILVADSLHTASDILSSLSVLIGLAAVSAGYPLLDPIAGVVIAGFIGRTGLLVLREATLLRRCPHPRAPPACLHGPVHPCGFGHDDRLRAHRRAQRGGQAETGVPRRRRGGRARRTGRPWMTHICVR